ncbi:hypothetical protein, partial [Mesorhizobium sp. M7A.F.Ca.US.007.01.1.1]|uniref:hypothetical protein n=1 Tax=Mesorhizobium sp. M7A.F.Ca.US.007.01.1.1 TaxID=2496712 RepID=UPI0019D314E1
MSADKKRQKCGGTSPIPTRRFIKVTGRDGNGAARGSVRRALQFSREHANFGWQRFILKDRGMTDDSGGTGDG